MNTLTKVTALLVVAVVAFAMGAALEPAPPAPCACPTCDIPAEMLHAVRAQRDGHVVLGWDSDGLYLIAGGQIYAGEPLDRLLDEALRDTQ